MKESIGAGLVAGAIAVAGAEPLRKEPRSHAARNAVRAAMKRHKCVCRVRSLPVGRRERPIGTERVVHSLRRSTTHCGVSRLRGRIMEERGLFRYREDHVAEKKRPSHKCALDKQYSGRTNNTIVGAHG